MRRRWTTRLVSALAGALLAACGISASAPSAARGASRPPEHTRVTPTSPTPSGRPSATTAEGPTTTAAPSATVPPTSTTAPGGSNAALVSALQAFFAAGCNGVCTRLSEPATAFSVTFDQHDPTWARWSVVDPSIGSGYGYARYSGGTWTVVAGPGSAAVGCPPSPSGVPARVLSDFGASCP